MQCLVWDSSLTGPIDLVADANFLRGRGVNRLWPMEAQALPQCQEDNLVFVCRPDVASMDKIAEHVRR